MTGGSRTITGIAVICWTGCGCTSCPRRGSPPEVRELRELVRYRAKLVALRTGLKAQLKAVLAKQGARPPVNDLWGVAGPAGRCEPAPAPPRTGRGGAVPCLVGALPPQGGRL